MLRLQAAVTNTSLGIPRLSFNLGIPHQNVDMEDGDKTHKSPGLSTMNPSDPSTAKPSILHQRQNGTCSRDTMISSTETIAMTMMISKSKTASKTESVFKDYKLIIKPLETEGRGRQIPLPCLISHILRSTGNGLFIGLTPCRMHETLNRPYEMVTPSLWDICPISTR